MQIRIWLTLALTTVVACAEEGTGTGALSSSITGADGGAVLHSYDWSAGDYPPDLHAQSYLELTLPGQGGRTRQYKVHVPPLYDASKPVPALYAFHGFQQNAVMFVVDSTRLVELSDAHGFILVMPNGLQEDLFGGAWNGGTCCGVPSSEHIDDIGFIRALHGVVSEHLNIDQARVYATGLSNGGYISHRLGCEAADLFAAIAPVAGAIGTTQLSSFRTNDQPDLKSCNPSRPMPVLMIHGDADPIVPYADLKPSFDYWAKVDGCQSSTSPAVQPVSGGDLDCVSHDGCPSGVEVTACTVHGGGHCWFGDPACGTGVPGIGNLFVGANSDTLQASSVAWNFLARFQR